MDTRWKNRLLIIAWFLLFTYGLNSIFLLFQAGSFIGKSYFEKPEFQAELTGFVEKLSVLELQPITKEEIEKNITVTDDEIASFRNNEGSLSEQVQQIKSEYKSRMDEAAGDKDVTASLKAEMDKKIADVQKLFTDDDYVKEKIMKSKEQSIDDYINQNEQYRPDLVQQKQSFKYYFKDNKTGKVYSNLPSGQTAEAINNKDMYFIKSYASLSNVDRYSDYGSQITPILDRLSDTFHGRIGVAFNTPPDSPIMVEYRNFGDKKIAYYVVLLTGILALLLSLFLYKRRGKPQIFENEKWKIFYNRLPIDVCMAAIFITGLITFVLFGNFGNFLYDSFYYYAKHFIFEAIFLGVTLIQLQWFVRRIKETKGFKSLWDKSVTNRFYMELRNTFLNRSVGVQTFILLTVIFFTGFGVPIVVGTVNSYGGELVGLYFFLFMIVTLPTLLILIKRIAYFNQINQYVEHMVKGYQEPDLTERGWSVLKGLAGNINTLKHGVTLSQEKERTSERLKTELITNVSHDLRTPLTSIITYSELLKTPDITDDERNTYIEVIDRKSKRLKVLIEDLFEASKMASGAVELVKEKVDIVQLLQQSLAENDERINESTLQFRVTSPDGPVYAVVDGQKLWRVFDNLIGNTLKYALENTRVYIAVKATGQKVTITFKNITKYELSENVDELFERFKRGDTSRHTEGSGLGLAIAKSIVDLHGGALDIEVDGDLFKVTVTLQTL